MSKQQEKGTYNVTNVEAIPKEKAFEMFGIKHIHLPTNKEGKITNISNGFCGSVAVTLSSGVILTLGLMADKQGRGVYLSAPKADNLFIDGALQVSVMPIGNTYQSKKKDGSARYIASTFIPKGMWDVIQQHVKEETKEVEIQGLQIASTSGSAGANMAA